ncbi:hypothetical protein J6590_060975 [Homalodisca vitripennis]|nr:hypothetical protein J6590_060975 [Homalodisca vitripennis]
MIRYRKLFRVTTCLRELILSPCNKNKKYENVHIVCICTEIEIFNVGISIVLEFFFSRIVFRNIDYQAGQNVFYVFLVETSDTEDQQNPTEPFFVLIKITEHVAASGPRRIYMWPNIPRRTNLSVSPECAVLPGFFLRRVPFCQWPPPPPLTTTTNSSLIYRDCAAACRTHARTHTQSTAV